MKRRISVWVGGINLTSFFGAWKFHYTFSDSNDKASVAVFMAPNINMAENISEADILLAGNICGSRQDSLSLVFGGRSSQELSGSKNQEVVIQFNALYM